MPRKKASAKVKDQDNYTHLVGGIAEILADARRAAARTVNALMTATYWEIGRRIVEFGKGGAERAEYGEKLLGRLSTDLSARFGRGFRSIHWSEPACLPSISTSMVALPAEKRLAAEIVAARKRLESRRGV